MTDTSEQALAAAAVAPRVTFDGIKAKIADEAYFRLTGTLTVCVLTLANGFTVLGQSACASPQNFNAEIGNELAYKDAFGKIWPLEGYLLREQLAADEKFQRMDAEMSAEPHMVLDLQGGAQLTLGHAAGEKMQGSASNQASGTLIGSAGINDDGPWIRERALELANRADLDGSAVVERARTFLEFLRGPQPPIDPPAPTTHLERMIVEFDQLSERLLKLQVFTAGDLFSTLSGDEQERMALQMQAMVNYKAALGARIDAATE